MVDSGGGILLSLGSFGELMGSVVVVVEAWQCSFSEGVAVGFLQRVIVSFNWGHLGLGCPKGGGKRGGKIGGWGGCGLCQCMWLVVDRVGGGCCLTWGGSGGHGG